jgi:hypothetical protein
MATNNRPLKSYIRYDGSGRAVSSSLIWRKNKPKVGNWKEVQGYECCGSGGGNCCDPSETYQTSFTLPGTENDVVVQEFLYIQCDAGGGKTSPTGLLFSGWGLPAGTTTIQEFINLLNGSVSPNIATFLWGGSTTINVEITSCLKNLFCPDSELLISYPAVPP